MRTLLIGTLIFIPLAISLCTKPAHSADYYVGLSLGQDEAQEEKTQPIYGTFGVEWLDRTVEAYHSSDLTGHDSETVNTITYNWVASLKDGKRETFVAKLGLGGYNAHIIDPDRSDLGFYPVAQLTVKYVVMPNLYMHWKQISGNDINIGFGSLTVEF